MPELSEQEIQALINARNKRREAAKEDLINENDSIGDFLSQYNLTGLETDMISFKDIYTAYNETRENYGNIELSQKSLINLIKQRGIEFKRKKTGCYFTGITAP